MKFKVIAFTAMCIANVAVAESKEEVFWFKSQWNVNGFATVHAARTGSRQYWEAMIATSKAGESNLYFNHSGGNGVLCTSDEGLPKTIKVSDRDIQVFAWCKEYSNKTKYISFTAKNPKGKEYIKNAFRKSPDVVKIDFSGFGTVYFSAKGFTKSWEMNTAL
jgi:hypothetical protein